MVGHPCRHLHEPGAVAATAPRKTLSKCSDPEKYCTTELITTRSWLAGATPEKSAASPCRTFTCVSPCSAAIRPTRSIVAGEKSLAAYSAQCGASANSINP